MWRSYYETFKDHLTHWQTTRLTRLGREFPPLEQMARDTSLDKAFYGRLYGYPPKETTDQPAFYQVGGICLETFEQDKNSYAYAHIPASWAVTQGWPAFRELVRHWCDLLAAVPGVAGPSLLFEPAGSIRNLRHAYGLLKRFPGLDVEEPGYWSSEVRDNVHKIRTINWLTVLGEPLIEEIGGRAAMREALGEDCPLFDYEGGAVIQVGTEPELGDYNFGFIPETYRKVARLTKPLRFEAYRSGALWGVPKPMSNLDETKAWIARFD